MPVTLARAHTFTIDGVHARPVTVEVDVRPGLPNFSIIGLADTAVRESRERVRAAILNSGYTFPTRRIVANLAPASLPKAGPGLDLALACALLAASGQLPREQLERHALVGELALDGAVRARDGALSVACAARARGRTLALAPTDAAEAALVNGLEVVAVSNLASAVRVLRGGRGDPLAAVRQNGSHGAIAPSPRGDLGEVLGQHRAVRALIVAAAGGHSLLLCGPPGTGKTMLAERLPTILPELGVEEAIEVARLATLGGEARGARARLAPFRAPHHATAAAGLVGDGSAGSVGEAVRAHRGVLFLDELAEFARPALQALRQPLEDGRVSVARGGTSRTLPARFMLVGAMNGCPCGHAGDGARCTCRIADRARYGRKLGAALIDRLEVCAWLERPHPDDGPQRPLTTSAGARERVAQARERQRRRADRAGARVNSELDRTSLRRVAQLAPAGDALLARALAEGGLSARATEGVLRVARTLADLDGSERTRRRDVAGALALRQDASLLTRDQRR